MSNITIDFIYFQARTWPPTWYNDKVEQAKRSGSDNAKTINAIECEHFCNFFKIPEQLYDAAFTEVVGKLTPKILGNDTD